MKSLRIIEIVVRHVTDGQAVETRDDVTEDHGHVAAATFVLYLI